jgi:WD40 repeat protein
MHLHQSSTPHAVVQGVSFLGRDDEFVMSGSDCGHVYVWDTRSGEVLAMLKVRGGARGRQPTPTLGRHMPG